MGAPPADRGVAGYIILSTGYQSSPGHSPGFSHRNQPATVGLSSIRPADVPQHCCADTFVVLCRVPPMTHGCVQQQGLVRYFAGRRVTVGQAGLCSEAGLRAPLCSSCLLPPAVSGGRGCLYRSTPFFVDLSVSAARQQNRSKLGQTGFESSDCWVVCSSVQPVERMHSYTRTGSALHVCVSPPMRVHTGQLFRQFFVSWGPLFRRGFRSSRHWWCFIWRAATHGKLFPAPSAGMVPPSRVCAAALDAQSTELETLGPLPSLFTSQGPSSSAAHAWW